MGKAFDATGSYEVLLSRLALLTAAAGLLMLSLPRYQQALASDGLMVTATEAAPRRSES